MASIHALKLTIMHTKYTENQVTEIKKTLARLENSLMTEGSHGYNDYKDLSILDASIKQVEKWTQVRNSAIAVIGIILGANRNWERVVQPNLEKIKSGRHQNLTFDDLQSLLKTHNYVEFANIWGHKDEKKYNTLSQLVSAILELKSKSPAANDYELMSAWAKAAKLSDRKKDSIGKIKNIGIATFQHLRLTFGVDTVKPDQRVIEVLEKEFWLAGKPNPSQAIKMVEDIAKIAQRRVALIDQIFVKYGSGYYKKA